MRRAVSGGMITPNEEAAASCASKVEIQSWNSNTASL
ncbi:hypothetical protein L917_14063 [Phytophthora nicotianae]|uniref:Uncharacterized protein n=1 Tax=Phytophthora nicotianae TaxID=4792 RepID=W2KMU8_PHYNI|nr:hypothetical protein L917_14063 [Phytophthora nicotianae]